ncbi:MAG: RES family NAD+ phosphorylase [Cytophagales bacterium]
MIVYRLCKRKFSKDISGTGSAIYGGRWNKKGQTVLYTGESPEITLLELLVHTPPMIVPDLDLVSLEIPNHSIFTVDIEKLPKNWNHYPAPKILSEIGSEWYNDKRYLSLKVPSSIVNTASNYILNCQHPDYSENVKIIDVQKFKFDPRLK